MFKSAIVKYSCAYRLVGIYALLSLFYITQAQAAQITLTWDAATSSGVAGYEISYGQASGSYTTQVDAGNKTSYTITGLPNGIKYYFAARGTAATPSGVLIGVGYSVDGVQENLGRRERAPGRGSIRHYWHQRRGIHHSHRHAYV